MNVTVNQFVCLFPRGTRIKVHMIFADREKTERMNDEDFGVWGDGEYYGITRYPVGECTVHEARMLRPLIKTIATIWMCGRLNRSIARI